MSVKIRKQRAQKNVSQKKLKFEDYKDCLQAAQLVNKTNHPEKNKTDVYRVNNKRSFIDSRYLF